VVAANQQAGDPDRARNLNRQGEHAYHAGRLDDAIAFYQRAIDADPGYGQAYSNLGLAYQKAGRAAEAIWADRKAIALASGPTAAVVRAGSNYNIGRLYEAAGQYHEALRYYEFARREKANPVYDRAVERVRAKP
jgi:tetratricopeptide (TPR) repeat protein